MKNNESHPSESLNEIVQKRIEVAMNNPMLESRIRELDAKLIQIGVNIQDNKTEIQEKIVKEILASSALANNIPEFQETLRQIAQRYGQAEKWAADTLEHENAHAAVAQSTGHEWVGYATLFLKDEQGRIVSIQPMHILKAQKHWTGAEKISKRIQVLNAPKEYGNKLSSTDKRDIQTEGAKL